MAVETAERSAATNGTADPTDAATVEDTGRFQRYRIRTGMFAWMAHRLSGLALVVYIVVHIWGLKALTDPASFNALIAKYHQPIFKVGEFMLLIAVVYHALNGLRIVLIDFLGWSPKQKKMFLAVGVTAFFLIVAGSYPSVYALIEYFGVGG